MTTFHLIRHGAHGLLGRVLTGRMPGVALDARGRAQAADLAAALAARPIAAPAAQPTGPPSRSPNRPVHIAPDIAETITYSRPSRSKIRM